MAEPKPKEWWEDLGFLTPEERDAIFAEQGYVPGSQFEEFEAFGTDTDEDAMFNQMMASMVQDAANQGLPANYPALGVGGQPEFTTKGALDPFDLSQYNKGIDTLKDFAGLPVDNALTVMAGPGAYGPEAFTPEIEYGKEIIPKGRTRLDRLKGQGGWEGFLAERLDPLGDNMSPTQAMAALQDFVENSPAEDPDRDPADDAYRTGVINSLRPNPVDPASGVAAEDREFWDKYNYETIYNRAVELTDSLDEDEMGFYDEATGKYYDTPPKTIKTPQMEWYDKYGLPYPTESYADDKYLQNTLDAEEGSTIEGRASELAQYMPELRGEGMRADEATRGIEQQRLLDEELLKAWQESWPEPPPEVPTRPVTQTVPGSAGIDYDQFMSAPNQRGYSTMDTTAEQAMLPTNVLMGGQRAPIPTGNPVAKQWGGLGEFDEVPFVRETGGQIGLLGRQMQPQPNTGQGYGVLPPGTMLDDPRFGAFDPFTFLRGKQGPAPRPLTEADIAGRGIRREDAEDRAATARTTRRKKEAVDPRLNDITNQILLQGLAQMGRTPLGDAYARRFAGVSRAGL